MRHHTPPEVDPLGDQLAHALGAVSNLNDTMQQLTTGMKTRDGLRLLGAEARPFQINATGQSAGQPLQVVGPSAGVLLGINIRETSGVATVVRVMDGTDSNGSLLLSVVIAANGDRNVSLPAPGVAFTGGLYLNCAGGVIEGAVYLVAGRTR